MAEKRFNPQAGLLRKQRNMRKSWGWYLTLFSASTFKIKLLHFKKNGQISMQRHKNRSELWLFLMGAGKRKYSGGTLVRYYRGLWMLVNESEWHQFKADKRTLVLEIQFGTLCEESDIERI